MADAIVPNPTKPIRRLWGPTPSSPISVACIIAFLCGPLLVANRWLKGDGVLWSENE
jgi:hypothetical protein